MTRAIWGLVALAAATTALVSVKPASALQLSQNAVQVFPAEGNGVCRDYAANDVILEMGPANPTTNNIGTVTGPDNPQDGGMNGESADYSYDPITKELSFTNSTTPVDFVLLKSSRQINAYLYATGGETEDFRLVLMHPDPAIEDPIDIDRVVLCYGLTDLQAPTPAPPPLATCGEEVFPGVDVICDNARDGTVITLWDPTLPPDDGGYAQCICNIGGQSGSAPCNPGPDGIPDLLACFGKDKDALPEAPVSVDFFRDPVTCSTIGGTRSCECVDNPFTPLVDECAP
ncbi:MAG: hypothetical protein OEU09_11405 [Rhodospirillales bacterium]|nr:hypothetical protein [Rhodospirillales bacterium]MDH3969824.1 hypothetical protein [Rhodospirillales bacterium]